MVSWVGAFDEQEPAFEELILLYTKDMGEGDGNDKAESRSLQLKIYERIPIPDLPVNISNTSMFVISVIFMLVPYFFNEAVIIIS